MTRTVKRFLALPCVLLVATLGALATRSANATHDEIAARDNFFLPAEHALSVGDTVTWVNRGALGHTVTSSGDPAVEGDEGGVFDATIGPGQRFTFTVTTPGVLPYFCRFHGTQDGSGMAGTLQVEPRTARTTGRLAGSDRFETAVRISEHAFPEGAPVVYLARADAFADALAGSSLAAGGPILLVPACGPVPEVVLHEIDRLDPGEVVALGGEAAVCSQVLRDAAAAP